MSADRLSNEIQSGRSAIRISTARCLLALPAALVSTVSVSVFRYMRSFDEIGLYYSGELRFLLFRSLSLFSLLAFVILFAFYVAAFHALDRVHLSGGLIALPLAFCIVLSLSMEHSDLKELFLPAGIAGNALVLLGFALLLGSCIELIYLLCDRKTQYRIWADELGRGAAAQLHFGAAGCILLSWLPILFLCYPGSVPADTCDLLMGWLGLKTPAASRPLLTTAVYGLLYQAGLKLGGQEKSLFLNILFQALLNAFAMGFVAARVCRYTRSKLWFWLTVVFFCLLPVWQSAAQVIMQDVLHTGCFLLFVCVYLDCLRRREKSWKNVLLLLLTALLVAYTGKLGFCLAAVCILVAALYHWRMFLLPYLAVLAIVTGLFLFSGPRLNPADPEDLSLPFQQVALYCRTYRDELTLQEIAVVNDTLDFEEIVREYTPMSAEKTVATNHGDEQNHEAFWQLYRQMLRRHPALFVKAAVMGAFEHFNPWFDGIQFRTDMARDDGFITANYKSDMHNTLNRFWTACLRVPVLRLLIGTGLYTWILLIALGLSIRKKSPLAFLGLIPALIWMVCLFMRGVNGDVRYGYPLIASAPLCLAWVVYAASRKSPEDPNLSADRLAHGEEAADFRLFGPSCPEEPDVEFEPGELPPELPAEEKVEAPEFTAGPLLSFVMRYIPVPRKPKTYLDFLKVLAIFLVLWNHTSKGFDLYNNVLEMPRHMFYLCFSIFDKIAVPLFFMASGALLLGREESWDKILRNRVRRFALILLVVSAISYVAYYRYDAAFSFSDFFERLYTGRILTPLWYLYSYTSMLLMLPFLRKLARCMREKDYYWLLGFYLVTQVLSVVDYFWFRGAHYHSSDFYLFTSWNYVVYALFGFYLERVMPRERLRLEGLSVLAMLSVLAVGCSYLLTEQKMLIVGKWSSSTSQSFFNTFIAIPSIAVFYAAKLHFTRHPVSGRAAAIWSILATGTFGTYLFERFWREKTYFVYDALSESPGPFPASIAHILVACTLGILGTLLYKILTGVLNDLFHGRRPLRTPVKREKPPLNFTVPTEDLSDLEEIELLLVNKRGSQNRPK